MRPITLLVALFAGQVATAQQSAYWLGNQGAFGGDRSRHAVAFDGTRLVGVMFGGLRNQLSTPVLGDTLEWDGTSWTTVAVGGPPARFEHCLAFDSQRNVVVMFGGQDWITPHTDTWEYDGVSWSQIATPVLHPSARIGSAMCFDSVRNKTVVFGGYGGSATGLLSDTWEWNGTSWNQVNLPGPLPAPRRDHAMVFDAARGVVVMFGGRDWNSVSGGTWEYAGTHWYQVTTASEPPFVVDHSMVYHAGRQRVVAYSGEDLQGQRYDDTWTYDGQAWSLLPTGNEPTAVSSSASLYDPTRNTMVATGGVTSTPFAAVGAWTLNESLAATATNYGAGCGTPALELQSNQRPVLGQTAVADILHAPTSIVASSFGWADHLPWPLVLPIELNSAGMPGCYLLQSNNSFSISTSATIQLTIPMNYSLIAVHVYVQAFAFAPGVNSGQAIASDAIDWSIGDI